MPFGKYQDVVDRNKKAARSRVSVRKIWAQISQNRADELAKRAEAVELYGFQTPSELGDMPESK